jgi:hypothetical protein
MSSPVTGPSTDHDGTGDVLQSPAVAVLEVDPTGHRLQYLRHLVEAASPERCVVLTTDQAMRSEEYAAHAAGTAARTLVLPEGRSRRHVLTAALEQAIASGAERLVVPDGDLYLVPLLLAMIRRPRRSLEIRLLLMRTIVVGGPEPVRPAMVVKPVLVQLLRAFRQVRIHFLTDALGVVTRRRGYIGVTGVRDPVLATEDEVRPRPSWFPLPEQGRVTVGVFGVISGRKNLPLLLAALDDAPTVDLLVGGRLEPDIRDLMATPEVRELVDAHRVTLLDRMLSPAEFSAALAHVDMVAVLHDNDSPSGILAEACARHTPVLVPEGGWLDQVAVSTGLGVATRMVATEVARSIQMVVDHRGRHVAAARRHGPTMGTAHFTDCLLDR